MGRQARAGHCLERLVKMAIPMLQAAQMSCPRKGRGDKPKIPEWVMAALIMIVVLKKKKTKSAQYRYLVEHRRQIAVWLHDKRFPPRPTYSLPSPPPHHLYRQALR